MFVNDDPLTLISFFIGWALVEGDDVLHLFGNLSFVCTVRGVGVFFILYTLGSSFCTSF